MMAWDTTGLRGNGNDSAWDLRGWRRGDDGRLLTAQLGMPDRSWALMAAKETTSATAEKRKRILTVGFEGMA